MKKAQPGNTKIYFSSLSSASLHLLAREIYVEHLDVSGLDIN